MDLEVLMRPLKPRTRAIFRQRMNGETMANIARSFGFSECRGNQLGLADEANERSSDGKVNGK